MRRWPVLGFGVFMAVAAPGCGSARLPNRGACSDGLVGDPALPLAIDLFAVDQAMAPFRSCPVHRFH